MDEASGVDVRVGGWTELQEQLYADSWQPRLGRFRSTFAYRGESDAGHDLRSSLARLSGAASGELEGHMLRNFRKYARQAELPGDSIWNWLALAQHHGLPTRLLDWTYSPFVAMHYATAQLAEYDRDGVIWMVDYARTNQLLPHQLKGLLTEEGSDVFTAEMLQRAAHGLSEFDALSREPFVAFYEPPSLDERIVNQFALFSLLSDSQTSLDGWLAQHPGSYRRVVIPAALKWEVRDKLDQANITERVLYPGLDGLSRWLRRYYTPRGRAPLAAPPPPAPPDDRRPVPGAMSSRERR